MNYFVRYRLLFSTVKTIRFVLCFAALLCCTSLVHAQDEPPVVDSVIAPPLEEVAPVTNNDEGNAVKIGTVEQIPEFRQVPDTAIQGLKGRKEFSYANDPSFWKPEPKVEKTSSKGFWDYFYDFFSSDGVRMIAYFLLIAFFAYVIYRIIVVNKLYLFYNSKKAKTVAAGEASDIQDINLDEKIQQALAAKDHRMAVRYMYLKALKLLNERQWIRYHADGTNYEYVNQMSGRKQASEFSYLTRIYDYVWYGEFAVTQEQFDIVYKNFSHFYNAVKS
jgi:uncharacterized protein DUF4129